MFQRFINLRKEGRIVLTLPEPIVFAL